MMLLLICSWVVGGIFLLAALYGYICVRKLKARLEVERDEYLDMVDQADPENHRLSEENSRLRRREVTAIREVGRLTRDVSDAYTCLELVLNDKPDKRSRYDPHQTTLILLP